MRHLWINFLLLALLATPAWAVDSSVKAMRVSLAKLHAERAEAYLAAKPDANDKLEAVNMLLDAYQIMGDFKNMVKYLEQRYELLRPQDLSTLDAKQLDQLVSRTALPLVEFHYRQFRYDKAIGFTNKLRADFKGHPAWKQLGPALNTVAAKYRLPQVGDTPAAAFVDFMTGAEVSLAHYKGRYVLLEFWVTNCDICKAQKGFLREAWTAYHDRGFEILAFSQNPSEEVLRTYLEDHPEPWHQCFDQDPKHRNAAALKVRVVPYNMLVDPEGKIAAIDLREQALLDFLEQAMSKKN